MIVHIRINNNYLEFAITAIAGLLTIKRDIKNK